MRILLDEEGLGWEQAWAITTKCCAYTNHTILPEALERWPVSMMEELLPRHLEIIYHINHLHMETVKEKYGDNLEKLKTCESKKCHTFIFIYLVANQLVRWCSE